jgi:hypothetical protein
MCSLLQVEVQLTEKSGKIYKTSRRHYWGCKAGSCMKQGMGSSVAWAWGPKGQEKHSIGHNDRKVPGVL